MYFIEVRVHTADPAQTYNEQIASSSKYLSYDYNGLYPGCWRSFDASFSPVSRCCKLEKW